LKAVLEHIHQSDQSSFESFQFEVSSFKDPWHYHSEFEIVLIQKGEGLRNVGDHVGEFFEFDFLLLGPDLPHQWIPQMEKSTKFKAIVLQFKSDFCGAALWEIPEMRKINLLLQMSQRGIQFNNSFGKSCEEIFNRVISTKGYEKVSSLFELLHRCSLEKNFSFLASEHYQSKLNEIQSLKLEKVYITLHQKFHLELKQSEIAKSIGLSTQAFSRFFKKHTNKKFSNYLMELRISAICRALQGSDQNIIHIAFSKGYKNISNFNRQFKKVKGMSPSEYRKKIRTTLPANR